MLMTREILLGEVGAKENSIPELKIVNVISSRLGFNQLSHQQPSGLLSRHAISLSTRQTSPLLAARSSLDRSQSKGGFHFPKRSSARASHKPPPLTPQVHTPKPVSMICQHQLRRFVLHLRLIAPEPHRVCLVH